MWCIIYKTRYLASCLLSEYDDDIPQRYPNVSHLTLLENGMYRRIKFDASEVASPHNGS